MYPFSVKAEVNNNFYIGCFIWIGKEVGTNIIQYERCIHIVLYHSVLQGGHQFVKVSFDLLIQVVSYTIPAGIISLKV